MFPLQVEAGGAPTLAELCARTFTVEVDTKNSKSPETLTGRSVVSKQGNLMNHENGYNYHLRVPSVSSKQGDLKSHENECNLEF
jgi:hypothetical protein